jgi:uncharacterized membrane protein (DUF4010 family)
MALRYLEAMERKKLTSAVFVFVVCVVILLLHGPTFPLAVITVFAGVYLLMKFFVVRRLRRDRQSHAKDQ